MLVDYVARHYCLTTPFKVWLDLLNWSLVLCLQHNTRKGIVKDMGRVPASVLETLWADMTEGYGVKPDIVMHATRARAQRYNGSLFRFRETMLTATQLFERTRGKAQRLQEELLVMTEEILMNREGNRLQMVTAEWLDLRRQFVLASLTEERDLQLLIVAIRTALREHNWLTGG